MVNNFSECFFLLGFGFFVEIEISIVVGVVVEFERLVVDYKFFLGNL